MHGPLEFMNFLTHEIFQAHTLRAVVSEREGANIHREMCASLSGDSCTTNFNWKELNAIDVLSRGARFHSEGGKLIEHFR